jgi:hypothetical protein
MRSYVHGDVRTTAYIGTLEVPKKTSVHGDGAIGGNLARLLAGAGRDVQVVDARDPEVVPAEAHGAGGARAVELEASATDREVVVLSVPFSVNPQLADLSSPRPPMRWRSRRRAAHRSRPGPTRPRTTGRSRAYEPGAARPTPETNLYTCKASPAPSPLVRRRRWRRRGRHRSSSPGGGQAFRDAAGVRRSVRGARRAARWGSASTSNPRVAEGDRHAATVATTPAGGSEPARVVKGVVERSVVGGAYTRSGRIRSGRC